MEIFKVGLPILVEYAITGNFIGFMVGCISA